MLLPEGLLGGRLGDAAGARSRPVKLPAASWPTYPQPRAVFLDALGTLVELEPPWIGLRRALGDGVDESAWSRRCGRRWPTTRSTATRGATPPRSPTCAGAARRSSRSELGREVDAETLMAAIRFQRLPRRRPGAGGAARPRPAAALRLQLGRARWPRCSSAAASPSSSTASSAPRRPARASPTRRSSSRRWRGRGLSSPRRRCTSATPPRRTSTGARAAGIRALLIDRDGGGDIGSLEEVDSRL